MRKRQTIIPPSVEDNIEKNSSGAAQARARRNRILSERLRGMRQAGAKAYEPGLGEQREVRDSQNTTRDDGPVVREEDSPDTGDAFIDDPYNHAGVSFNYLATVAHRQGPDGSAGRMLSLVHYSEDGSGYDNAAYYRDPKLGMVIVVGDGSVFPPFHLSPGVFYHEWGHAFTEATCGLGYTNEPGGNNEGGSDILSALTEQWFRNQTASQASWLLAPELFTMGLHGRALRDFLIIERGPAYDDPLLGRDTQIQTADQFRRGMDPHTSSSIPNGWFAHACLKFPDKGSWETIGPIWFRAWTTYMTPTSGFAAMAASTVQAAIDLHGTASPELDAVKFGWDVVKVTPAASPSPAPTPTPAPGSTCTDAEIAAFVRHPGILSAIEAFAVASATHPVGRRLVARGLKVFNAQRRQQ